MSFNEGVRGRSRKQRKSKRASSLYRSIRFETLEDRRLLAVSATVSPEGVVQFTGDGAADLLDLFVDAGSLKYTGGGAFSVPLASITQLNVDLGGGADVLTFGGAEAFAIPMSGLTVTNVESTHVNQSIGAGGDVQFLGGALTIGIGEITVAAGGLVLFQATIDADVPPPAPVTSGFALVTGDSFLAWQRGLGRTTGATTADGDMDGDGDVDGQDLTAWRQDYGDILVGVEAGDGAKLTVTAGTTAEFTAAVGSTVPLSSLSVQAPGGIRVGAGELNSDGNSMTFNSPLILTADLVITDAGDVTFNDTVNGDGMGPWDLTVNTPSMTVFNGAVGGTFPLDDLTTDVGGETHFGVAAGTDITTSGDQDYNDAVVLTGNATLSGTLATSDVTFDSTVNGAFGLLVTTAGVTTLTGQVGNSTPLASLATNGGGTTQFGAAAAPDIATTGNQTFTDNVVLLGAATLTAVDVTFSGTVNGAFGLTVTASGTTTFTGQVGNSTPLASLTTNGGGTTQFGAAAATDIATTGNQTYTDNVVLVGAATLSGVDVSFGGTVNGAFDLVVTASGTTTFTGQVSIANLTTNGGGTTQFGAAAAPDIATTGNQTYTDNVVLLGAATLTAVDVTFGGTVTGAFDLIVSATGTTTFGGQVSIANLTTNGGGTTRFGAAATPDIATTGNQTYTDNVVLLGAATLTGVDVTFGGTVTGAFDLVVSATGVTTFTGQVSIANLTTNGGGTTQFGAAAAPDIATTGNQTFTDNVVLLGAATLTGVDVTFGGTVTGAFDLVVSATGVTTFTGQVSIANLTTNGGGTTQFGAAAAPDIATTGNQTYTDNVVLLGAATLTGVDVTFGGTVTGAFDLIVSATGVTTFTGQVSIANLTTNGGGTTQFGAAAAPDIATTGNQTYTDNVVLLGAATLTAVDVTFGGTVTGAFDLIVSATGVTTFTGQVSIANLTTNGGGTTQFGTAAAPDIATTGNQTYTDNVVLLGNATLTAVDVTFGGTVTGAFDLLVTASGTTTFTGQVSIANLTTNGGGTTRFGAAVAPDIATTGNQTYTDNVVLLGNATLTAVDVTFGGTVTGAFDLLVTATGVTTFTGQVSIANLTTNGGGTTQFGAATAPDVATTGNQTYTDNVVLLGAATLTGVDVTFGGTVTGAFDLIVSASGTTTFTGQVSIANLTTNGGGTTQFGAAAAPDIATTGNQTYTDNVVLLGAATLTAVDVTFGGTVTGAFDLIVSATGVTTFSGQVSIANLTTNNGGTTQFGTATAPDITTTGDQTYTDNVVLTGNALLLANDVTFVGTVTGPFSLQVTADGITGFGGQVSIASLGTDGGGTTTFGVAANPDITTTGDQTYADNVLLTGNAVLVGNDVTFGGTVNGAVSLLVTADGNTTFEGRVGGVTPLTTLTTNGGGLTRFNIASAGVDVTTTGNQQYDDAVTLLQHTSLKSGNNVTFNSTVNDGAGGPWDLTVDADRIVDFNGNVGVSEALQNLTVRSGGAFSGPFMLDVMVVVTANVDIEVREVVPAAAGDNYTQAATGHITADGSVHIKAGDDLTFASGATIDADGTLTIDGDFGDNDAFATTITTVTATPAVTDATGMLRGALGITIRGGDDSTDVISLQADRLVTPAAVTVQGYLTNPALSGNDDIMLVFSPNFVLAVGSMTIDGGENGDQDRLTLEHSKDTTARKVAVLYTDDYTRTTPLPPPTMPVDGIGFGDNSSLTGYGATGGFNVRGIEKYWLKAGSAPVPNDHDHIHIQAADQTDPTNAIYSNFEQRILVSDAAADFSNAAVPYYQWIITGWESGQLEGSNVRDAILNGTDQPNANRPYNGVAMLIEGHAGNDTLVGGATIDVIFSGPGAPFSRLGLVDEIVLPPYAPVAPVGVPVQFTPVGVVRRGDTLIGAGGDDFLFADIELVKTGMTLSGVVTLDAPGEADLLDGSGQGSSGVQTDHGAQFGVDYARNITGMFIDGGAVKNTLLWLRATPMPATPANVNMLIQASFFSAVPGKVGLTQPPYNALFNDFDIEEAPAPAVAADDSEEPSSSVVAATSSASARTTASTTTSTAKQKLSTGKAALFAPKTTSKVPTSTIKGRDAVFAQLGGGRK